MAAQRHVGWALAHAVLPAIIAILFAGSVTGASRSVPVPQIDGPWWQVAGNPMDHKYATPKQEPVDFAVWQAADGTWQLWSCIRGTTAGGQGGRTRFFYRWEGKHLTDPNWSPMGIALEADPALGETPGGLQAPHVIKAGDTYHLLYGDWVNICHATSSIECRSPDITGIEFSLRGNRGHTCTFSHLLPTLPISARRFLLRLPGPRGPDSRRHCSAGPRRM